jgi:hypothetical protein
MNLTSILVVLVVVGVILFLINNVVPMVAWMKQVINVLAALFVFLYLLQVFGLIDRFHVSLK